MQLGTGHRPSILANGAVVPDEKRRYRTEPVRDASLAVSFPKRHLPGAYRKGRLFRWTGWPAFRADPYGPNRFNVEYEDGCGFALSQPKAPRECSPPDHIKVDRPLCADALKEGFHSMGRPG